MDVLSVGGKDYVKASVIARDLGYTPDYVGQLCRNRKVNAKLVGRTWYVDRNSIHVHKENRYRSTQSKSIESLKESIGVKDNDGQSTPIPIHVGHTPTSKVRKPAYVAYSEDSTGLIPEISKAGVSIPIGLADAKEVKIDSKSDQYLFETPALEPIRFHGKLELSTFDEDAGSVDEAPDGIVHPKWKFGKGGKKAQNLAISSIPVHVEKRKAAIEQLTSTEEKKVSGKHAAKETHIPVEGSDTAEEVLIEEADVQVSKPFLFAVAASSALLVLLLLGAESQVTIAGESVTTSYSFALENLTASAYSAVENLESIFYIVEFSTNLFIF